MTIRFVSIALTGLLLAGCGTQDTQTPVSGGAVVTVPDADSGTGAPDTPSPSPEPSPTAEPDAGAESVRPQVEAITREEAAQIALDEFGGVVDDVDSDEFDGIPAWEVELEGTNRGIDLEVYVDKETGEILYYEED